MPDVNCSDYDCGSCRRTRGIGTFKVPLAKDDAHRRWRDEWLWCYGTTLELKAARVIALWPKIVGEPSNLCLARRLLHKPSYLTLEAGWHSIIPCPKWANLSSLAFTDKPSKAKLEHAA